MQQENRESQIKFLHEFISQHRIAVLATVTGSVMPEAAVVGIAVTDKLEMLCATFADSRKHANIQNNPRVALVIGWDHGKTVQYEGVAEQLSPEEVQEQLKTTFANVPTVAKYVAWDYQVMYKISPRWACYSDISRDPWDIFEVLF